MARVELLLLLMLALSLCHSSVGGEGKLLKGRCSAEERDALITFKRSLFDPHRILSIWDSDEDCCNWTAVNCSNTTGNVIKLDLSWSNEDFKWSNANEDWLFYARSFDPSLFRLQHLQYLSLSAIHFNNAIIPRSIDSLTYLYYLDLSDTSLVGEIPPQLGNLTNLQHLDLSLNSLAASNLQWMSHLSSLQYLDMSDVDLTYDVNWLHELTILPLLSTLRMHSCGLKTLSNFLPYSNFSSTIKVFDISSNQFSNSTIPSWLFNMTNLFVLSLSDCQFQGTIPNNSLAALYKLEQLDLSNNLIDGCIPEGIKSMSNLMILSLAHNRLSGSIPYSLGQLLKLSYLDLSNNQLHGSLSDVHFEKLSVLYGLDISNNHLDFNMVSLNWVPPFQLGQLFLSSCPIGPNFPSWLKTQEFLEELDLSNSSIFDIIPSWFVNIFFETLYLNMSNNAIRGELPLSLNIKSKAVIIDLRSNLLEGHLPGLTSKAIFALFSNNKFSKGIEGYLNANMSSLKILDLSYNHLYDEIPNSICQMPSIILLHLSHNNLSGKIPNCASNISSINTLKFMGLAYNNFWGLIPQWVGNLPMLISLYLSNNNFHGEIPLFKNCSNLVILDFGQNQLAGYIPSWIGEELSSLKILCLRSNQFFGSIPSNLSKLKRLQILYLANNLLSGSLPKSFKLLDSMTIQNKRLGPLIPKGSFIIGYEVHRGPILFHYYGVIPDINFSDLLTIDINGEDQVTIDINGEDQEVTSILDLEIIMDLSCNNLTGEVPTELMSLIGLRYLNLSKNQFTGRIPRNIDAMQSIEILDLSRNNFSGEIPESIAKLSKLSCLNLSYNQLSGQIPTGTQLGTFNESCYMGNPKLCGKPLVKSCEGNDHNIYHKGNNSSEDDDNDDFGLFLGMGIGFAVGLWSVLGTLILKRQWAIAYFQLYHNVTDRIYVFIAVKWNQWFNQ